MNQDKFCMKTSLIIGLVFLQNKFSWFEDSSTGGIYSIEEESSMEDAGVTSEKDLLGCASTVHNCPIVQIRSESIKCKASSSKGILSSPSIVESMPYAKGIALPSNTIC